jgi:type IX secretion system PorP/SprF family membrane protein
MGIFSKYSILLFVFALYFMERGNAQSMHFSQFYNAPLLINPANTGLLSENDYRVGANHRSQWVAHPAPYYSTSAYGDFQVLPNEERSNWMGIGLAFYNDNVGDGKLSLFRSEAFMAYHIMLGEYNMISFGGSASYNSRSINFSKYSFPMQWDGSTFNRRLDNQENKGLEKASYFAVNAGLNYAYLPHEDLYVKVGLGVANLNRPLESFYTNNKNYLSLRYFVNADVLYKVNPSFIINPLAYYSRQGTAQEIVFGSQVLFNLAKPDEQVSNNQFILGAFNRFNDAVIGVVGLQYFGVRFTLSYDYTISSLPTNSGKGSGALELSLRYEGVYYQGSRANRKFHCPRF